MSQPDDIRAQLTQFSDVQLSGINPGHITAITVHLILTTAFFSGALLHFAKANKIPKAVYLPILIDFLADTFGLTHENAAGMVESNARMYKRYVLVEKVYQQGWSAAQQWQQDTQPMADALKNILHRYHQLSMASLNIEGIKEKPVAPAEIETLIPVIEAAPTTRKNYTGWLLAALLTAAITAGYFLFFR